MITVNYYPQNLLIVNTVNQLTSFSFVEEFVLGQVNLLNSIWTEGGGGKFTPVSF